MSSTLPATTRADESLVARRDLSCRLRPKPLPEHITLRNFQFKKGEADIGILKAIREHYEEKKYQVMSGWEIEGPTQTGDYLTIEIPRFSSVVATCYRNANTPDGRPTWWSGLSKHRQVPFPDTIHTLLNQTDLDDNSNANRDRRLQLLSILSGTLGHPLKAEDTKISEYQGVFVFPETDDQICPFVGLSLPDYCPYQIPNAPRQNDPSFVTLTAWEKIDNPDAVFDDCEGDSSGDEHQY